MGITIILSVLSPTIHWNQTFQIVHPTIDRPSFQPLVDTYVPANQRTFSEIAFCKPANHQRTTIGWKKVSESGVNERSAHLHNLHVACGMAVSMGVSVYRHMHYKYTRISRIVSGRRSALPCSTLTPIHWFQHITWRGCQIALAFSSHVVYEWPRKH